MKALFLAVSLLYSLGAFTQSSLRYSVKPTYAFTKASGDLEDAMRHSGFDDYSYSLFSDNTTLNPMTKRDGVGLIGEVEWLTSKKVTYSLAGGLPDWGEVQGYDHIGAGNYLDVKYYTFIINPAVNYHYYSHKAAIGPALAAFNYRAKGSDPASQTAWTVGVSASNTFFPEKERRVMTGFFLQLNMFPNITTKPIVESHQAGFADPGGPQTYTSTLQPEKVNISHIQLGVAIQF